MFLFLKTVRVIQNLQIVYAVISETCYGKLMIKDQNRQGIFTKTSSNTIKT